MVENAELIGRLKAQIRSAEFDEAPHGRGPIAGLD